VKKVSITLEPDLDRAAADLAASRGITKAELIRRLLQAAVNEPARPRLTAIGVGAGPGDAAADVDQHLDDTGFGRD
jgi:Ribbon-helix-helix protein, copG family